MDQDSNAGREERPPPQTSREHSFEADIRMPTQQEVAVGHPLASQRPPLSNTGDATWNTTGTDTPYTPLTPPTEFPSHDATAPLTRMDSLGRTQELNPFEISIYLDDLKRRLEGVQQQETELQEAQVMSDDQLRAHFEYLHARLTQVRMEQMEGLTRETASGKTKVWRHALSRYRELKVFLGKLMKMIRRRSKKDPPRGRVYGRPTYPFGGNVYRA